MINFITLDTEYMQFNCTIIARTPLNAFLFLKNQRKRGFLQGPSEHSKTKSKKSDVFMLYIYKV